MLAKHQIVIEEQKGYLQTSQHGNPVHVAVAFEALPERAPELFFPRSVTGITSRDQLDQRGKVDFISKFGLQAFETLPATAPKQTTVTLDSRRLARTQWLSLDLKTRAELSAQWGAGVVGQIMGRVK